MRHLLPLLAVLLLTAPGPAGAADRAPWESRFMAAPAAEVLAAAKALPRAEGANVHVLFEELVAEYRADGALSTRYRQVYHVITEAGLEGLDRVAAGWSPWFQDRPKLRARIVAASGRTYQIDPATIEESTPHEGDTYGDSRALRAPLPGIGKGAVVEIEIVESENKPPFAAGWSHRFYLTGGSPVAHSRLVIDRPVALPVRVAEHKLPAGLTAKRSTKNDREIATWDAGPLEAAPELELGTPPDALPWAYVGFTSGSSWAAVAQAYSAMAERQIGAPVWADWVRDLRRTVKQRGELIARITARLARDIRYTGIEFGESSIVPRSPQESLRLGFGDCKDKSLLLVSLLRAAGIEANVALLRAGIGPDVDPELPGLGAFNHAIVQIPGPTPLWIDPTNQYAPPGELPIPDQGRLALIAGARTTALVRTPTATSTANLIREVREVTLREQGAAHVVETTETSGTPAQSERAQHHTTDRQQIEKHLTEYVHDQYDSPKLLRFETSDPSEVDRPFRLVLEMETPRLASVWDEGAEVLLKAPLLTRLPDLLRDPERREAAAAKRSADFVTLEPYVYEVVYRITPPHGFTPATLPAADDYSFGPARLTHRYASDAKGVVTATFRFDSGKSRLSPAEVQTFREGIRRFYKQNIPAIAFVQTGAQHLAANHVRSALDEFWRLDREHPRQALHQSQIAEAYLAAGLGPAARKAAQAAVDLDGQSARAWRVLGWVLEHDLLGRRMRPGWDRKGAEAAYRKALALEAGDRVARASLAILLEHDDAGERSYPKRSLDEVIALYENIRKDDAGTSDLDINHLLALFHRGRLGDVVKIGRPLAGGSTAAAGLVLAAIALQNGGPAAVKESSSLVSSSNHRPEALRQAAAYVMSERRYPVAAGLYREAARGHDNGVALRRLGETLDRTRPRDELKLDDRNAISAAKLILWWITSPSLAAARDRVKGLVPSEMFEDMEREQHQLSSGFRRLASKAGLELDNLIDMMLSSDFTSDGDPRWGLRVTTATTTGGQFNMTLVPQAGRWRLVRSGNGSGLLHVEVMRLLKARDLDGARYLLDLAVEGMSLGTADDVLSAEPLARVWTKGLAGDDAAIALGATVLEGLSDKPAPALESLQQCRRQPPSELVRIACEQTLIEALSRLKRPQEAVGVAADVRGRYPRSLLALLQHTSLLMQVKDYAQAIKLAQGWLQAHPDETAVVRLLGHAHELARDLQKADEMLTRLLTSSRRRADDLNQLAWMRIARGRVDEEAVKLARQAVEMSSRNDTSILNTLAAVLAETNKPEEAREVLLESIEEVDEPRSCDWYVAGRIAEGFGARDAARESYARVKPDRDDSKDDPMSCWSLVQRRLATIKK